jgi:hypothetical protein
MPPSTRAERVAARDKSKQRQQEQEPPKKKPRKEAPGPADHKSSGKPSGTAPPSRGGTSDSTKSSREDYNERTPERTDLLTRLKSLLKVHRISSTFWACCQLCDIECLKDLVETAETRPNNVLLYDDLLPIIPSLCKSLDFQDSLRLYLTVNILTLYRDPTIPRYFKGGISGSLNLFQERIKDEFRWREMGITFENRSRSC